MLKVDSPPIRPLLVYDGDCGFCRRQVVRLRALTGDHVDYAPFQEAAARFPQVPLASFEKGVQFIETDGRVSSNALAIFRALHSAGSKRGLLEAYEEVPGFARGTEAMYRLVAGHRGAFGRIDRWFFGNDPTPPTWHVTQCAFLRLLGIVYLIAFVSLWLQVHGLIGSQGILPIADVLHTAGLTPLNFPTLCWLNASDGFLHGLCAAGVVLSSLLILGVFPIPVLALLWALYLSLTTACGDFLAFQWDSLLLEAGFLAIILAPFQAYLRPTTAAGAQQPSRVALWLNRWLLFRLMFLSGIVKLASGDEAWRGRTAMHYHYETQPLPAWTSWYAAKLPDWFQRFSVTGVLFIELFLPLLIFAPRRLRLIAFWGILLLQILIAATGNYGFFNLLSIVLCLTLLDDRHWLVRRLSRLTSPPKANDAPRRLWRWPLWVTLPLAAVLLPLTIMAGLLRCRVSVPWPPSMIRLYTLVEPYRMANAYGLFEVMTTTRPEIILEGSDDGETWRAYEFRFKPGDVRQPPRFTTPLMPRLDWQMWFAAGNPYGSRNWLLPLVRRLLEGSPQVLHLLKGNPFPDHRPRLVRATMYDYRFTSVEQRRASGAWWRRERTGELLRPLSLADFQ